MIDELLDPLRSQANLWLVITAFLVALSCALPGTYLVLRRMALTGDAITHSVLPGIVAGFLLGGGLDSPWLLAGAALAGLACVMLIEVIHQRLGVREDAATGIAFTTFFALGVLGLRLFASKVDLDPDCVLFGSLETAVNGARVSLGSFEVPLAFASAAGASLVAIAGSLVCGRAWTTGAFDPLHARCIGFRDGYARTLLLALVAMIVTAAFQAVGAILAVALLILPGACGLLVARRIPGVLLIATLHALLSAIGGFYLAWFAGINAAAAIVLAGFGLLCLAWAWSLLSSGRKVA
ncbi:metal ABC transporter permease [Luteolibacter sp. Populi]|uniref:metal ABC transporter permease n=1 Tax=Luteolibacter sp. Populi TaxID=3230487 RepID=UPI0034674686